MAIRYQFNKTSLQQLEKQLKVRGRALPTIKNKESALRLEVKKAKPEVKRLDDLLDAPTALRQHGCPMDRIQTIVAAC
jgi:V/A-type H+-transporting ATPase subunit D